MADVGSSPPAQKVSRYRSQRKGLQQTTDEPPLHALDAQVAQQETAPDDSISRSKSRYRRRPSGDASGATRPIFASNQEQVNIGPRPQTGQPTPAKQDGYGTQSIARPTSQRQTSDTDRYQSRHASPAAQLGAIDSRRVESTDLDWGIEEERRKRLQERYSAQRNSDSPASPLRPTPTTQISGELFPPPRPEPVKPASKPVLLDGPPTSDQIRATKSMSALPNYNSDDDQTSGCFGLFKRKRGEAAPPVEKAARSIQSKEPMTIKPGGGGVVPGTDAPVSAVNTGERRVLVECGKSKNIFPVTPTTTPVDIIKSASNCMSERIDVDSAILLESFGTVGIQRPLRRYEHIRDIMNSWDTDRQNSLILIDPGTGSSEIELSLSGVPRGKPGEQSWILLFSQKVGKWDKRIITLRRDGQVTASKDPEKPKDAVNVCHLSDFDIYTPTREKSRRKIKPPKKICFAIKSQQKTSMFESTHDFVHFFSTNDRQTADSFYAAVQSWRSWYLVNVMGEGKKPKPSGEPFVKKEIEIGQKHSGNYQAGIARDSGYQLGSFKPLMDTANVDRRPMTSGSAEVHPPMSSGFTKSSKQFDTTVSPERRTSTNRRKQHPHGPPSKGVQLAEDEPLANLGRRGSVDKRRHSIDQTKVSPEEFLTSGLLGRKYSQRRKEFDDRETQKATALGSRLDSITSRHDGKEDDYGEPGPRSPDGGLRRTHSTRAQNAQKMSNSGDLQRTNSRAREVPKPLVDLTPQYREPPQHIHKGRGYVPDNIGAGPLIENATSPEDPIGLPPSVDWRGRNAPGSHHRTNSLSRNRPNSRSVRRPATSSHEPNGFTGDGLLAGSRGERGRGVMDGNRTKDGPLVDLNESSTFHNGSLLNKVEREQGLPAPVIDRSH